jgi:hypothetical protein
MLAATYDSYRAQHDRAACLLVEATIVVGYGCGLLPAVLSPLLASLGSLLGILDDNVG